MDIVILLFQSLLLSVALCTDTFVCCFAYGASKIKIPFLSVILINCTGCAFLTLSLLAGNILSPYIPDGVSKTLSFAILFLLGSYKLITELKKSLSLGCRNKLSAAYFKRLLSGDTSADANADKILSPAEAVSLSVILSLDGIAAGFSAAVSGANTLLMSLSVFAVGCAATALGIRLGRIVSRKVNFDLSCLSGTILILIAFSKLLG